MRRVLGKRAAQARASSTPLSPSSRSCASTTSTRRPARICSASALPAACSTSYPCSASAMISRRSLPTIRTTPALWGTASLTARNLHRRPAARSLATRKVFGYIAAFMAALVTLGQKRREPKPEWLKVRMPGGGRYEHVRRTLRELNLSTVCEEASCPNMGECWGSGTATVMLMGDVCTRGCRFCDVNSGIPGPLDPLEPRHLAQAVGQLGLDYLVVTSVNRDELPDGGASHFAQAIVELRRAAPRTLVEVLTPDFQGSSDALQMLVDARPTVAAHNLETVERLTPRVRDRRAAYPQSLEGLESYNRAGMRTKRTPMLGVV